MRFQRHLRLLSLLPTAMGIALVMSTGLTPARGDDAPADQLAFFENEIRPLLVKHCFECHSDKDNLEGGLSVKSRGDMTHGGESGPAVLAGNPKESLLIKAVEYRGIEMPPNGKLPKGDIDKLVRWVEMGLPWTPGEDEESSAKKHNKEFQFTEEQLHHWAFQPITAPVPPQVDDPDWNRNPIDQFLRAAMDSHGVAPNTVADRAVLLRRVTYDLTGLPPTPDELHDFLADDSPQAWDKVITRLLASPHYGERWGRHWLDVIRYADTAGDASDYPLPDAYKYRNYVINSFNNDKPYDRFLREQYAGDLIAAESPREHYEELTTATTHLALSRRFGYNDTNFYYFHLTIQDLLDTMGQSVLGLSIGCARCHDHKFEPVSAKDYYALYGIFSSSRFTFPGGEEVRYPKDLVPAVPRDEAENLQHQRKAQIAELNRLIQEQEAPALNLAGSFDSEKEFPKTWTRDKEAELVTTSSSPFLNVFPAGTQSIQLPNNARNLGMRRPVTTHNSQSESPLYLNVDFQNVSVEAGGDGYYRIALDHPENGFSPAVEVFINASHLAVRDGTALKEVAPLTLGTWYNLQLEVHWTQKSFSGVLSDGSTSWNLTDIPFNPSWDGTVNSFVVDAHGTEASHVRPLRALDNISLQPGPFPPATHKTEQTLQELQEQLAALQAPLQHRRQERDLLNSQPVYATIYGVQEGKPANAQIQYRGEPDRLGEEVPRGFLSILGGEKLPEDCHESGRRELAEWLTSPDNPLTDRVIVNRIWHYHFGRGIVSTPNDFGVRGQPPTHPELLDFLATTFREQGHSFKAMHRLILTSRAYQLSSIADGPSQSADPVNTWFWRYNRHRLDAESLRDTWLNLSGELDTSVGAAHPFPPVSTWTFSQHVPFDAVYESRQRTVYLMTQRIKRHPFLALFDGADPNATTGKRESTTTPAQALFMMNDDFIHQRALALARRLQENTSAEPAQIKLLYELAYSRQPSTAELFTAGFFRQQYSQQLAADSDRELLSLAAYVRTVLSSNELLHVE